MKDDNQFVKLIFDPKLRIFWHILFWLFIYLDEVLSLTGLTPDIEDKGLYILTALFNIAVIYFNLYVLIPQLLNKGKIILYLLASIISVLLILYVDAYYYEYDMEFFLSSLISNTVFNAILLTVPVTIKLFKQAYRQKQLEAQSEAEKLNLEISYLKHQVNPHFLFNTLNSLYIQSKRKNGDGDVSESILSFSDLLRYQLYECQKEYVTLEQEVDYLQNYLALEKRRRDQLDITFQIDLHNNSFQIEPLLFVPLIENAVKYSQTDSKRRAYIECSIKSSLDEIYLKVKNNKGFKANEKSPESGIGLSNLKRRLELYYPKNHDLTISDGPDYFIATLKIRNKRKGLR